MRPIVQIPPIRKVNGEWSRSNQQKAGLFVEHLERTFQPYENRNRQPIKYGNKEHMERIPPVFLKEVIR